MVKGTVINARGNETGVVVNGKVAMVYGNQFVLNHFPLEIGSSTIEAVATDTDGNAVNTSIVVNRSQGTEYIRLSANVESGISPLEVTLTLESSLDLSGAAINCTGPGPVEILSNDINNFKINLVAEGIYLCSAALGDLSDTIGILVFSEAELDALLRGKWEGMKTALSNKDVEKAMSYISGDSNEMFRYNFELMKDLLPAIVNDMGSIEMIKIGNGVAEYRMSLVQDGEESSFYIEFITDYDGLWKISFF
jgi:hypothetical protein